ncbi:hypothetical protein [Parahaliea mediterranea]|uniref:DUF883 family protein n=1 Tax=Parahaliea mediterranea TaxID=651086 RepID=A0A939DE57_9GAMM|nr:hypothetical protein [Parahaliea mediterranea]MBN7796536.1 hypothetical protein [Parahaliea mediterranea]
MPAQSESGAKDREAELAASKAAAMEAYEKLLDARLHFRQAAAAAGMDLKEEALEQIQHGREKAEELGAEATRYVRDKPLASLGLAFLAGYILAQVFGRR